MSRKSVWWVLFWAWVITSLYLPSLTTRFDFIDDGNLVYPSAPMPLAARAQLVWQKVVANYENLGPFRPVLWAHWELQAELFRANSFRWRLARVLWAAVATCAFLWLLLELGIHPAAALLTAALAMWNPYRSEIWRSLTLSEGVAMPYAVMGLVCAVRAGRSARPWRWDVAGMLCILAALGCKNTFAAVVPAQMLLRVAPDGQNLRSAWQHHGRRAEMLALTLLLPVVHFIVFRRSWHPGQYPVPGPSREQLGRMLYTIKGAAGADFFGPGLVCAAIALVLDARAAPRLHAVPSRCYELWVRYRATGTAGLALMVFGVAIYLPINGVCRRYSIPAVWGVDLWIAALFSALADARSTVWKRTSYVLLYVGLLALAVATLAQQDRFAARAAVLWQALEFVEQQAPHGAELAWVEGRDLDAGEGIHFYWHLQARSRSDLTVSVVDAQGHPLSRPELPATQRAPSFLFTGSAVPLAGGNWVLLREFTAFYWGRTHRHVCYLWTRQ